MPSISELQADGFRQDLLVPRDEEMNPILNHPTGGFLFQGTWEPKPGFISSFPTRPTHRAKQEETRITASRVAVSRRPLVFLIRPVLGSTHLAQPVCSLQCSGNASCLCWLKGKKGNNSHVFKACGASKAFRTHTPPSQKSLTLPPPCFPEICLYMSARGTPWLAGHVLGSTT